MYKEGIKKVYDKDQKFVQLSYLYTIFNICQISNLILTLIVSKWSAKSGISDIWKHLLECTAGVTVSSDHKHLVIVMDTGLVWGCQGLEREKDIKEFKK